MCSFIFFINMLRWRRLIKKNVLYNFCFWSRKIYVLKFSEFVTTPSATFSWSSCFLRCVKFISRGQCLEAFSIGTCITARHLCKTDNNTLHARYAPPLPQLSLSDPIYVQLRVESLRTKLKLGADYPHHFQTSAFIPGTKPIKKTRAHHPKRFRSSPQKISQSSGPSKGLRPIQEKSSLYLKLHEAPLSRTRLLSNTFAIARNEPPTGSYIAREGVVSVCHRCC